MYKAIHARNSWFTAAAILASAVGAQATHAQAPTLTVPASIQQTALASPTFRNDIRSQTSLNGHLIAFTPASTSHVTVEQAANGLVIGEVKFSEPSTRLKLPAGAYKVMIGREETGWKAYLVQNGAVVARTVLHVPAGTDASPKKEVPAAFAFRHRATSWLSSQLPGRRLPNRQRSPSRAYPRISSRHWTHFTSSIPTSAHGRNSPSITLTWAVMSTAASNSVQRCLPLQASRAFRTSLRRRDARSM